jgi:hypothetical protein
MEDGGEDGGHGDVEFEVGKCVERLARTIIMKVEYREWYVRRRE